MATKIFCDACKKDISPAVVDLWRLQINLQAQKLGINNGYDLCDECRLEFQRLYKQFFKVEEEPYDGF
jgi:hypothetical protein